MYSLAKKLCCAAALTIASFTAQAGEGSFGWIYTLDLQPKGTAEFEQRLQMNRGQAHGKYDLMQARTEIEYGVSENFQIAAYLNTSSVNAFRNMPDGTTGGWLVPTSAGSSHYQRNRYDGVSLEGIWRLTNPVTDPLGVGFYLEVTTGPVKDELEGRLLLQSNFLDDKLVVAANLHFAIEKVKFDSVEIGRESMADLLAGVSYRFAPNWSAGIEYRFHNDFDGYRYNTQTQRQHFIGPNIHYATKDWWVTAAWRMQPRIGKCWAPGDGECSGGYVWDSHSRQEVIVKFGMPL